MTPHALRANAWAWLRRRLLAEHLRRYYARWGIGRACTALFSYELTEHTVRAIEGERRRGANMRDERTWLRIVDSAGARTQSS